MPFAIYHLRRFTTMLLVDIKLTHLLINSASLSS